jgi:hypothetical protein
MTPQEKYLYHQIHPLKLLTDWASGLLALYPLWRHQLATGVVIMLVPPAVVSCVVIRYANLEPQRESPFGRYVGRFMTHTMEVVRLAGFIVMAIGAWNRSVVTILLGAAIVLFGWLRGLLIPSR